MDIATRNTAETLFGADAVAFALTRRSTPSAAFARRVERAALSATPESFARWFALKPASAAVGGDAPAAPPKKTKPKKPLRYDY